jgi:hypothetical protein
MSQDAQPSGIVDQDGVRWWASEDVRAYLASVGKTITRSTWSSYVARGQAPKPGKRAGSAPLWHADVIREWHSARAGQGARTDLSR